MPGPAHPTYTPEALGAAAIERALQERTLRTRLEAEAVARERDMTGKVLANKLRDYVFLAEPVIDQSGDRPRCIIPWEKTEITFTIATGGRGPQLYAAVPCPRCEDAITARITDAAVLGEMLLGVLDKDSALLAEHCQLQDSTSGVIYMTPARAALGGEPPATAAREPQFFAVSDEERALLKALRAYLEVEVPRNLSGG